MVRLTVLVCSPEGYGYNLAKYTVTKTTDEVIETYGGHAGRVVSLSPPISEIAVQFPARPQVGKLVVSCRWSTVYSTEP